MMRMPMEQAQREKFLQLFDAHADELFSYCRSRIRDQTRALELIEATFMKSWDHMRIGRQLNAGRLYKVLDELLHTENTKSFA